MASSSRRDPPGTRSSSAIAAVPPPVTARTAWRPEPCTSAISRAHATSIYVVGGIIPDRRPRLRHQSASPRLESCERGCQTLPAMGSPRPSFRDTLARLTREDRLLRLQKEVDARHLSALVVKADRPVLFE